MSDFNLDGLMVLRTEDTSEASSSKTDKFQQSLLAREGVSASVPFENAINLSSWRTAIAGLSADTSLLILECELIDEPEFQIGRVLEAGPNEVTLRTFTGAANWEAEPIQLGYADLTSCQANTNYVNFYQRHFERTASLNASTN